MQVNRDFGIDINPIGKGHIDENIKYINIKLASMGLPYFKGKDEKDISSVRTLIEHFREKD
ncbi:MAG: hypothetical protein B6229_01015, partial [Spirochaetaceae bacterium 4572_7]